MAKRNLVLKLKFQKGEVGELVKVCMNEMFELDNVPEEELKPLLYQLEVAAESYLEATSEEAECYSAKRTLVQALCFAFMEDLNGMEAEDED